MSVKKICIKNVSINQDKIFATVEIDGEFIKYVRVERVYFNRNIELEGAL